MTDPEPIDPRRRIRELTAIPERDRTDEQWDELNELEIRTAPGNRESNGQAEKRVNPSPQARRPDRSVKNNNPRPDARPQENRAAEGRTDGRPPKRQHRRPKRPSETPSGSGGAGGGTGGAGGAGGTNGGGSPGGAGGAGSTG